MNTSTDAEKGVLSSLALAPVQVFPLCDTAGIEATSFSIPAHRLLYSAMVELHSTGKPVDFITIATSLHANLEKVGGAIAISELFTYLPTALNAGHYIGIVAESQLVRKTQALLRDVSAKLESDDDPGEVLAAMQSELLALIMQKRKPRKTTKQTIREVLEEIQNGRDDSALMLTGIEAIDRELKLFRTDYLVIPGPTSSGKSALSSQIATAYARQGLRVLIFALEMSSRQLVKRALASESGYNAESVRQMAMSNRDLRGISRTHDEVEQAISEFAAGAGRLAQMDLTIIDDVRTLDGILSTARAHAAEKPLDVLVVDYPALMSITGAFERRQLALGHAANSFKMFAQEINGLVITPSQVNKEGGTREAADFEHAANAILSVQFKDGDDTERTVTITKQRDGARGQALPLYWHGLTTRFIPNA